MSMLETPIIMLGQTLVLGSKDFEGNYEC